MRYVTYFELSLDERLRAREAYGDRQPWVPLDGWLYPVDRFGRIVSQVRRVVRSTEQEVMARGNWQSQGDSPQDTGPGRREGQARLLAEIAERALARGNPR